MLSAARHVPHQHTVIVVVEARDEPDAVASLLDGLGAVLLKAIDEDELSLVTTSVRPDLVVVNEGARPSRLRGACQRIRSDPLTQDLVMLAVTGEASAGGNSSSVVADATVATPTCGPEVRAVVTLLLRAARGEDAARRASRRCREPTAPWRRGPL